MAELCHILLGSKTYLNFKLNDHSHYFVFHVHLWQMVAFLQGDRKFPISVSSVNQPLVGNYDGHLNITKNFLEL